MSGENSTGIGDPPWAHGATLGVAVASIASASALLVALIALITVECIAPQMRQRHSPYIESPQASPTLKSGRQSLLQS